MTHKKITLVTGIVACLAGLFGAVWAVYSHFNTAGNTEPLPQVSVTASSGGVAVGGSIGTGGVAVGTMTGGNINTGPTDENIRYVVTEILAQESPKQIKIEELSRSLDIRDTAVTGFFRSLEEKQVPPERWSEKLSEIAEQYKQLLSQLATGPGDAPEIARLKDAAKTAVDNGDLEKADALLAKVLAAQDATLERSQLDAAATAANRGTIALTRLRYRDAAAHFAAAAKRVPPSDEELALAYLEKEAEA